jgi:translocation and assembly module TamB
MEKKPLIRRILIGAGIAILALLVLCVIILNTAAFRDFLRDEIVKQARESAGATVTIGSVETNWTHLGLDLNDVVMASAAAPGESWHGALNGALNRASHEPALLTAKQLTVSAEFLPLLHGKLELRDLILVQPVVHLRIDSQGRTNLPTAPKASTSSGGPGKLFDLEIQNCAIESGEIFYNDAQIPMDAELHDLKFGAGYSIFTGEYKGSLSYDKGLLATRQVAPLPHAMQVQFTASRSGLSIAPLVLTSGASRITLNAKLTNYENPSIEGTYAADLVTGEFAKALRMDSLPLGRVSMSGVIGYSPRARASALAAFSVEGRMQSDKLAFPTSRGPLVATAIGAEYALKDANLRVSNLVAGILGGHAKANLQMLRLDASSPRDSLSRLDASLQGVSLTTASDQLAPRDVRRIRLIGTTNMNVQAAWSGSVDNAIAHVRLAITSPPQAVASRAGIPVNGLLKADYDGPRNVLSFGQSYVQTSSTKLTIAGTLSSRGGANSNIAIVATAADLQEVGSLATLVQNALEPPSKATPIPEMHGSAALHATITGTAKDPHIRGQLTAQRVAVDSSHWRSLSVSLDARSSRVEIQNGVLDADPRGQVTFSGNAGLQHWSLAPDSAIGAQISVANMPVADVEEIARLNYPVTGTLTAKISVRGTRANPEGTGQLALSHASAWNETINNLTVNADSHGGAIRSTVNLQIPAGALTANASYKLATQEYQLHLTANGINLQKVSAIQHGSSIQGIVNLSAIGTGTVHNPQLEADLAVPTLRIQDQTISGIDAHVSVAHEHANLTLRSVVDQGSVDAKGDVDLTGSHYATATLDVRALPIAAVAANFISGQSAKIGGQTEIHLSLKGPLSTPAQMEAHLEIPTFNVSYGGAELALVKPLQADYRGGTITLLPTKIQGTGTNLTLAGTIPVKSTAAYAVSADGSVDLSVLQKFAPDVHSSGLIEIHLASEGKSSQPNMHGELQIKNAILTTDSSPVGLEGLNAQINISGNRADIVKFEGTAGGGTVNARGFYTYGHDSNFGLALDAQSVRIRYPEGLRSILSGRLNVQGTPAASTMTGRVLVDRLSFTQAFDLANFAGSFSEDSGGGPSSAFERNMKLNVALQSASDINLSSSKLSMAGSANLNLTGTLADPVLLGRITLTSGEVFFLSKRFEVQSGAITFANPVRTDPVFNLAITTTIEQYNVTVNLTGPVDRLQTNYTSDPALAPADIIHLLAFGDTNAEAASTPSEGAAMGAESALANGVTSQVSGKLQNLAGISQLTIDPLATDAQGNPGTQVAIQQRITGSLLFTFSTDVTSTQSATVELQYQLNKQVSITTLRDQNGGYAIGLRLHKQF